MSQAEARIQSLSDHLPQVFVLLKTHSLCSLRGYPHQGQIEKNEVAPL